METGRSSGLDAVGIARAEPFHEARVHLETRKAAGFHAGMSFTYRNPTRSTDPTSALPGARALIVGARSYRHGDPVPPVGPHGRVARYAWADRYEPLRAALGAIAVMLRARGYRTRLLVDDNTLMDREAAYRAGLGWYGKNCCLLLPGVGSWFVLGSVLTDAPLEPTATEPLADGCGSCTRCLPACPTGAFVAPGVLDARRCLAWLVQAPGIFPVEHRVALGDRVYGCDECQEVCPPNRAADRRSPPPPALEGDRPWVDLVWMITATDQELLAALGRWYLPGRDVNILRRNALLALANVGLANVGLANVGLANVGLANVGLANVGLGNVGLGGDPECARALALAVAHHDPVVRAHAVWACGRLGRLDLVDAVRADPSALVQAELARWPPPATGPQ